MPATDATLPDPEDDLALIRDAAREAGEIAMRHFRKEPESWFKHGASPVSVADIAVDDFLRATLRNARPDYGWLSEETIDNPERLLARRTFVVDPIDGTRAFLEGRRTWCVSIAVVEAGEPLAGVLDCPARNEIYEASLRGPALRNGVAMAAGGLLRDPPAIAGPKAILSRAPAYMRAGPVIRHIPSLAYRVAMVASGELDATFVKANSHDWDLAAADLILSRTGGAVIDENGARLSYAGPDPRHGILAAGRDGLLDDMARVIGEARP